MQVGPLPVSEPLDVDDENRPVHRGRQCTHLSEQLSCGIGGVILGRDYTHQFDHPEAMVYSRRLTPSLPNTRVLGSLKRLPLLIQRALHCRLPPLSRIERPRTESASYEHAETHQDDCHQNNQSKIFHAPSSHRRSSA